jgi:hypothetical protein
MDSSEIIIPLCGGLIGLMVFTGFFLIFGWATLKRDLYFHGGRIQGKMARVIGVIGLLGLTASAYLGIYILLFKTQPPFAMAAIFLSILFIVVVLGMRLFSIFSGIKKIFHKKRRRIY